MTIEIATAATPELVEAMARLIPQLSRTAPALTGEQVAELLAQPGVELFLYRSDAAGEAGRILGMLSLATFAIPTGLRAWIEDVVVDAQARGRGAGAALVQAAVDRAEQLGARSVDLTSRPSRESANRLYRRVGFAARETNVYRYSAPAR